LVANEYRWQAIAPIKWPFIFPPCDDSRAQGYTDIPTLKCVSACIVGVTSATRTQDDIVAATEGCALACAKPPYALNPSTTSNQSVPSALEPLRLAGGRRTN
jgi:hypothetical protein